MRRKSGKARKARTAASNSRPGAREAGDVPTAGVPRTAAHAYLPGGGALPAGTMRFREEDGARSLPGVAGDWIPQGLARTRRGLGEDPTRRK